MNLPNKLTILRLLLAPIGIFFVLSEKIPYNFLFGFVIFVFAMATDVVDGYIARKYHLITKLGTFLDPLVDKLIIIIFSLFLTQEGIYPLWLTLLFVSREIIVDAFRNFATGQNIFLGAIKFGKIKALFQTFSVSAGLLFFVFAKNQLPVFINFELLKPISYYSMLVAFLISVIGFFALCKKNFFILFK